jgi:hypothetical protein
MIMRCLITILFALSLSWVNAQPFINDPNYIYGEGRANTLEEADKLAMSDLLNQLRVNVRSNSDLILGDDNGRVNRKYGEKIETSSELTLRGTLRYIDDSFTGKERYRVYRYFNKTEYVRERKKKAMDYVALADENHWGSAKKGTINITLGYYYLAYQCVDDDLFTLLDGANDVLMAQIIAKTRELLDIITLEFRPASKFHGYYTPYDPKSPHFDPKNFHVSIYHRNYLMRNIDFEYWDGIKWSDSYKKTESGDVCQISCTSLLPRNVNGLKYRIVYQTFDEDGKKIKLFVPEEFYLVQFVEAIDRETINEWIEADRKNGFYNLK